MRRDEEAVAVLRRAGQKVTPQRLMVLSALRHRHGHATASEIFAEVRETYPYVDISTVYRTLASLRELKLITETDMGGGDLSYEWAGETPHHHLVCKGCGSTTELAHAHLVQLGESITQAYGFQPSLDHFAIFGLCIDCAGHGAELPTPQPAGARSEAQTGAS